MEAYSISFDGRVLNRGFWLYVIVIDAPEGRSLYIGRTGDSSSAHASSPFSRIGQHLDHRPNAKGNALGRQLRKAGIDMTACTFEMIGVGPIFPEEKTFELHRPVRDRVAALEKGLAAALRGEGYTVLGEHACRIVPDVEELDVVLKLVRTRLAEIPQHSRAG